MVSQKENKAKNKVFGIKVLDFSQYFIFFSIISFGNKELVLAIICYLIILAEVQIKMKIFQPIHTFHSKILIGNKVLESDTLLERF